MAPQLLETMGGFHKWIYSWINSIKPQSQTDVTWLYPPIGGSLEDAGLWTVE